MYALDSRNVECGRVVRAFCRTLPFPNEERCEEWPLAPSERPSMRYDKRQVIFLKELGPVSVAWRRKTSRQPTERCEQNTHSNSMYRAHRVSQHILNRMIAFHHANTRDSIASQNSCHPRVMSRSLSHLTLTTSTSSLSPTSPIFPTFSPSHPSPLAHDPHSPCEDSRQSGGSTQIPPLTGSTRMHRGRASTPRCKTAYLTTQESGP